MVTLAWRRVDWTEMEGLTLPVTFYEWDLMDYDADYYFVSTRRWRR